MKLWYLSLTSASSRRADSLDILLTNDLTAIEEKLFLPRSSYSAMQADEYMQNSSAIRDADDIAVPLLAVHYEDDPLVPWQTLPLDLFSLYPHLFLLTCPKGGHCGVGERLLSATTVAEDVAASFVDEILLLIDPLPAGQHRNRQRERGDRLNTDRKHGALRHRSLRSVGYQIRSTC